MSASTREPRNPFYAALLVASIAFAVTALAFYYVPVMEEKARATGQVVPRTAFHRALREHGGTCLLVELAAMILFGFASMGLDRLRRLQNERKPATIPPATDPSSPLK